MHIFTAGIEDEDNHSTISYGNAKKLLSLTVHEFAWARIITKSRQKCLYDVFVCVYITVCVKRMWTPLYLTDRGRKWMMCGKTVLIRVINHCLASCHKGEITLDTIIEMDCMAILCLLADNTRHTATYVKILPHYLLPKLNFWRAQGWPT